MQERPYGATDETTVLEVYVALGTSQTCRGCRGNWKLGSLEAWKLGLIGRGSAPHFGSSTRRALAARSVHCFLFSVLWGA